MKLLAVSPPLGGNGLTNVKPLPEGFQKLVIPQSNYVKFTTDPAPMTDVVVNAWRAIWDMSPKELGGKRCYQIDFEIYDERAADHQNIILDLYVEY